MNKELNWACLLKQITFNHLKLNVIYEYYEDKTYDIKYAVDNLKTGTRTVSKTGDLLKEKGDLLRVGQAAHKEGLLTFLDYNEHAMQWFDPESNGLDENDELVSFSVNAAREQYEFNYGNYIHGIKEGKPVWKSYRRPHNAKYWIKGLLE